MKDKCISLIDKFLYFILPNASSEEEMFRDKARGLVFLWSFTTIVMWLYVLYCYHAFGINIVTTIGLICTCLHSLAPFVFKLTKSIEYTSVTISLTGLVFQTIFCFHSGGVYSPAAIWLSIHPIILAYFGLILLIYLFVIINFFIIVGLYFFEWMNLLPPDQLPSLYRDGMIVTSYIGLDFLIAAFTIVAIKVTISYNRKLNKNNQTIENLVRVLSHDINNSLTIIQLASKRLHSDDKEKRKKAILYEVVNNIISNAIKFSFPKNIIQIEAKKDKYLVYINVRDYGTGVDDKTLKNSFSPTARTSHAGTNNEKGTGYGLPIAFTLLSQMNGELKMENMSSTQEKAGTKMSMTFLRVTN